jgi:hypothetical protein
MLDYPEFKDWYVAEISQVLNDQFTVNGFITTGFPLAGYRQASKKMRVDALKGFSFIRTWCKDKGKDVATMVPPKHLKSSTCGNGGFQFRNELDKLLLVRNVGLDADGCLCKASRNLAAALKFPHHVGAGGEETSSWSGNAQHGSTLSLSLCFEE